MNPAQNRRFLRRESVCRVRAEYHVPIRCHWHYYMPAIDKNNASHSQLLEPVCGRGDSRLF
eukprot:1156191-Pelagomonas_calceolata.AAC.3